MFDEGRSLLRALIDSGDVSGFKDPRTVLTWPFWVRVFKDFPGLRIVPVSLLRSPHEIAMSLVTRRNGWCGYWNSLDVVAVHLRRQMAILASWGQSTPGLCFGSPSFVESLAEAARQCGLSWDKEKALEVFDQSCVHQTPAAVDHEAQGIFDALCNQPGRCEMPRRIVVNWRKMVVFSKPFGFNNGIRSTRSFPMRRHRRGAPTRLPTKSGGSCKKPRLRWTGAGRNSTQRTRNFSRRSRNFSRAGTSRGAGRKLLANHRTCNAAARKPHSKLKIE